MRSLPPGISGNGSGGDEKRVMNAAPRTHAPGRGAGLLMAHCAALGDAPVDRTPAFTRLEAIVGGDLARLLVYALAGAQGLLGSSSP